jgi:hypothetical protein
VGMSFVSGCIWFMYVLMWSGCIILVSYIIKMSST